MGGADPVETGGSHGVRRATPPDPLETGGSHGVRRATPPDPLRYRCALCGNLTRFDVIERRRTRSFYHYTLGGLLSVDEEDVIEREVEEVLCRWCNSSENVTEVSGLGAEEGG